MAKRKASHPPFQARVASVAIVTTAGLHRRGDAPFRPGEQGYRAIPADTPASAGTVLDLVGGTVPPSEAVAAAVGATR